MDTIARKLALLSVGTGTLLLLIQLTTFSVTDASGVCERRTSQLRQSTPIAVSATHSADASSFPSDDFVPKDIAKAAALGCVVAGDKGPPPFVEVQVFVKTSLDGANWDYRPKVARYAMGLAGINKALDECVDWYHKVKQRMEEASRGEQAH